MLVQRLCLNFQPLESVFRYRDSQLQVDDNYLYSYNLNQNIFKIAILFNQYNNQSINKTSISPMSSADQAQRRTNLERDLVS